MPLVGHSSNHQYPCEEEEQTIDHLIFKCKKLSENRNEMIKQIKETMVAVGPRVMKHSSIIIYNFFVTFVKSIDFSDLQWGFALKDG